MKNKFFLFIFLFFTLFVFSQNDTISVVKHSESSLVVNKNSKVVYRGIHNLITITVPNSKSFTVTGNGIIKVSDYEYNISPGLGLELIISIDIVLNNKKKLTEKHKFRIKNISKFINYINDIPANGIIKRNKMQLNNAVFSIRNIDSNLDFKFNVREFTMKIPNSNPIVFKGNYINNDYYQRILKARKGDIILFSDIKQENKLNLCISLCGVPPIVIELID